MSVSNFELGGTSDSPSQATKLFFNNSSSAGTSSDYVYNKVPFGGNTSLSSFVFKNFDVSSSTATESEEIVNPLYKTTKKT